MGNKKTNFAILGLLSIEPMSGYDMKKFIGSSIGHFWSESNGQLYPALKELLKQNFVNLMQKKQRGTKASDLYSITKEGSAALEQWLEESTEGKSTHRDEELLKLFFGKNTSTTSCVELLKKREKRVREKLEVYFSIQKRIEEYEHSPHRLYWNLTLRNGIAHAEAEVRWCQESIRALKS